MLHPWTGTDVERACKETTSSAFFPWYFLLWKGCRVSLIAYSTYFSLRTRSRYMPRNRQPKQSHNFIAKRYLSSVGKPANTSHSVVSCIPIQNLQVVLDEQPIPDIVFTFVKWSSWGPLDVKNFFRTKDFHLFWLNRSTKRTKSSRFGHLFWLISMRSTSFLHFSMPSGGKRHKIWLIVLASTSASPSGIFFSELTRAPLGRGGRFCPPPPLEYSR